MDIAKFSILFMIFVLFISCVDSEPRLSNKYLEWKTFNRNVDSDDPNYPLEVLEDGYKMIRAYRVEARKIKNIDFPARNEVEWGWKYTVKNKSSKKLRVTVTYILKDKDLFEITSDSESEYVDPNETITIRSTSNMNYDNINRISYSGWKISYSEW
jgi:hypothetical protein